MERTAQHVCVRQTDRTDSNMSVPTKHSESEHAEVVGEESILTCGLLLAF